MEDVEACVSLGAGLGLRRVQGVDFVLGVTQGFLEGRAGFLGVRGMGEGSCVSSGMKRGEVRGPVSSIDECNSGTRSMLVQQKASDILMGFVSRSRFCYAGTLGEPCSVRATLARANHNSRRATLYGSYVPIPGN